MKKKISRKRMYLSCSITFILSLIGAVIPQLQSYSNQIFSFGLPIPFLNIRASQDFIFSTSLNIGAFTANILLMYGLLTIIKKIYLRYKNTTLQE